MTRLAYESRYRYGRMDSFKKKKDIDIAKDQDGYKENEMKEVKSVKEIQI